MNTHAGLFSFAVMHKIRVSMQIVVLDQKNKVKQSWASTFPFCKVPHPPRFAGGDFLCWCGLTDHQTTRQEGKSIFQVNFGATPCWLTDHQKNHQTEEKPPNRRKTTRQEEKGLFFYFCATTSTPQRLLYQQALRIWQDLFLFFYIFSL